MGKRQIEHTPDFKYPCVSVYVGVCVCVCPHSVMSSSLQPHEL